MHFRERSFTAQDFMEDDLLILQRIIIRELFGTLLIAELDMPRQKTSIQEISKTNQEITLTAPLKFTFIMEGTITLSPTGNIIFTLKNNGDHTKDKPPENLFEDKLPKLAYSIKEVAKLSSISRATIYREISLGNLITHKIGMRRVVIFKDDLSAWFKTRLS